MSDELEEDLLVLLPKAYWVAGGLGAEEPAEEDPVSELSGEAERGLGKTEFF